jgi:NADPH:quinone reductase-like Zn-dependent oxidoreductase
MAAPDVPATMTAFVYTGGGGMKLEANAPVPKPKRNQVLVQVLCAGLNPVRAACSRAPRQQRVDRAGGSRGTARDADCWDSAAALWTQVDYKTATMPASALWMTGMSNILSRDFAGVVVRSASPDWAPGDRVFGNSVTASLAQYALADASAIAKLQPAVSPADAASLPVAGLTAMQAFTQWGHLKPGDKVLVPGASGGTGTLGVQIAKCLGASLVAGVCSGANAEMVRGLGADVVADYTLGEAAVEAALRPSGPFDLTYDCVTSAEDASYEPLSRKLLKPGGMHVAINGVDADYMRLIFSSGCCNLQRKDFRLFISQPSGAQLSQLAEWVAAGKLKVPLDARIPFEEAAVLAAYDRIKSRRVKGKLVVDVLPAAAVSPPQAGSE